MTDNLPSAAEDFLQIESLIKSYLAKIEKLKKDLRDQKQMLTDALEADAVYHEHSEKAKEANRVKSATKQQILKQPALQEISEKVKDMKFDLQEQQAMLNDYLSQYQQLSGATQIEAEDGEVLEIVSVVKLVKRRKEE